MSHRSIRPAPGEFAPYYADYIALVPDGDLVDTLIVGAETAASLLHDVPEETAARAYAEGKWTLKEVVQHCSDAERIFAYRVLRIARGDQTELPGWDEKAYTPVSGATARSLVSLLDEFESVREATVTLLEGLPADAWTRRGRANGASVSVRGVAWITAGHLLHHMGVVQQRYLGRK